FANFPRRLYTGGSKFAHLRVRQPASCRDGVYSTTRKDCPPMLEVFRAVFRRSFAHPLFCILSLSLFPFRAGAQGYNPAEAAGKMTVYEGAEVALYASEPMVRQPVAIEFDDRGRLWVVQYLQYPNPEGLE